MLTTDRSSALRVGAALPALGVALPVFESGPLQATRTGGYCDLAQPVHIVRAKRLETLCESHVVIQLPGRAGAEYRAVNWQAQRVVQALFGVHYPQQKGV